MKKLIVTLLFCIASGLLAIPSAAQTEVSSPDSDNVTNQLYFLARAKNLARQAAIKANGGLEAYRPENSMYGPALEAPFERNSDGSVTFSFLGGAPGAQQFDKATTVNVTADSTINILFNGPVAPGVGTGKRYYAEDQSTLSILQEDSFLTRAQNLARQAGISENGGLSAYRPEAAMFGPADEAPHFENIDGSITFNFKGGAPLATSPTLETWVNVTPQGQTRIEYNGPVKN